MLLQLPAELQLNIVSHISNFENLEQRTSTLAALALCNKFFSETCQQLLHQNISIRPGRRSNPSPRLYNLLRTLLIDKPDLASKVQRLSVAIETKIWDSDFPYLSLPLKDQLRTLKLSPPLAECFRRGLRQSSPDLYEAATCILLLLTPNLHTLSVKLSSYSNGKNLLCRLRGHEPQLVLQKLQHFTVKLPRVWHVSISPSPIPLLQSHMVPSLKSITLDLRAAFHPNGTFNLLVGPSENGTAISIPRVKVRAECDTNLNIWDIRPICGIEDFELYMENAQSLHGVVDALTRQAETLERISLTVFLASPLRPPRSNSASPARSSPSGVSDSPSGVSDAATELPSNTPPNHDPASDLDPEVNAQLNPATEAAAASPQVIYRTPPSHIGSLLSLQNLRFLRISEFLLFGSRTPVEETEKLVNLLPPSLEELVLDVSKEAVDPQEWDDDGFDPRERLLHAMEAVPLQLSHVRFVCKVDQEPNGWAWVISPALSLLPDTLLGNCVKTWRPFIEWKMSECAYADEDSRHKLIRARIEETELARLSFKDFEAFEEAFQREFDRSCLEAVEKFVEE